MNQYNAKWSELDWADSHARGGNLNYRRLEALQKQTKIPFKRILRLCNKVFKLESFKAGKLIFTETDAEIVKSKLRMAMEIAEALAFEGRINEAFYTAVKVASETEGYRHERMIRNCKNCRGSYNQMSKLEAQLQEFSRIYNYRAGAGSKIYFERYMKNKGYNVRNYDEKRKYVEYVDVSTLRR